MTDNCGCLANRSISLSPASIDFLDGGIGTMSVPRSITLTNTGVAPVRIREIVAVGDFKNLTPTFDEIRPGETVSLWVAFEPQQLGNLTGGLYVDTGNAGGQEFVSLRGNGVANGDMIPASEAEALIKLVGDARYLDKDSSITQIDQRIDIRLETLLPPALTAAGVLKVSNNLDDVGDPSIARANLGIATRSGVNIVDPPFNASLSAAQTPSERHAAMQAAIDFGAAHGLAVYFPPGTWLIDKALKFRNGGVYQFAGIDVTILKLSDDAPILVNVWEPLTRDGSTRNVTFIGGFTIDGNYTRPPVNTWSGGALTSCGFITGGAREIRIIGGIKAVNCPNHGIDVCNGGEDLYKYVNDANMGPTYHPANETIGFYADLVIVDNNGDDGFTTHYSHNIQVGTIRGLSAGNRHPTANAGTCVELDDGTRNVQIGKIDAVGGGRVVTIKCHDLQPGPSNVTIGEIIAEGGRRSIHFLGSSSLDPAQSHTVNIGSIIVRKPATNNPADVSNPYQAFACERYANVTIGAISAEATGGEAFSLADAVLVSNSKHVQIGSVTAKNWPWNNTASSTIAAVQVHSNCQDVHIGHVDAENCGFRGIVDAGGARISFDSANLRLTSGITGSTAFRAPTHPSTRGGRIGAILATGYDNNSSLGTPTQVSKASIGYSSEFRVGERKLIATSTAGWSHTGSTADTTLLTLADIIPAGVLGLNGILEIETYWTAGANNANVKSGKVLLAHASGAPTEVDRAVMANALGGRKLFAIQNKSAANAQLATPPTQANSFSTTTAASPATYSFDTSKALSVEFAVALGNAADTLTLERYAIWVTNWP